jgi:hypothetical protein
MEDNLTKDEFEALAQIRRIRKGERVSACVARNAKRLTGLKYIACRHDGVFVLTEKGQQTLFVKRCIDGLRAVANAGAEAIEADVATFLSRKGLITSKTGANGFDITERGRDSLADIEARESKQAQAD